MAPEPLGDSPLEGEARDETRRWIVRGVKSKGAFGWPDKMGLIVSGPQLREDEYVEVSAIRPPVSQGPDTEGDG